MNSINIGGLEIAVEPFATLILVPLILLMEAKFTLLRPLSVCLLPGGTTLSKTLVLYFSVDLDRMLLYLLLPGVSGLVWQSKLNQMLFDLVSFRFPESVKWFSHEILTNF